MELTKKHEFVEVLFTGKANGTIFDTNEPEQLKQLDEKAKPLKLIVAIGEGMVLKGLDNALEGKEFGKRYHVALTANEGFGPRRRELVRTIPLKAFTDQRVFPQQGMTLSLDGAMVRISAVSGSRVIADFNNPLAGKDLTYDFTITHQVHDVKERAESFFAFFMKFLPELHVDEKGVQVKAQKQLEPYVMAFKEKFEKLVGKPLHFHAVEKPKEKEKQNSQVETQQSL